MRFVPFAQLLDETLAAEPVRSSSSSGRPFRPAPVIGFFDFTARPPQQQPTARAARAPWTAAPALRPIRHFSPRERVAFDELVGLGATLREDFTADELRRAFRELARRFHPDRHQGMAQADLGRLSELFRRAHKAYRTLQAPAVKAA